MIKRWWKRRQQIKRTIKELESLSDRELADLGIHRMNIRAAVEGVLNE